MKSKSFFWVMSLVLLFAVAVFAQASKSTDPVSGNWGDPDGPGFDLKFDGKMVSGTIRIVNPAGKSTASIRNGTFDSDTSVLKLEGEATAPGGDGTMHFLIEGKISGATVSGTYHFGESVSGDFTFDRRN